MMSIVITIIVAWTILPIPLVLLFGEVIWYKVFGKEIPGSFQEN